MVKIDGVTKITVTGKIKSNVIGPSTPWMVSGSIGNSFQATKSEMKLEITVPSAPNQALLLDSLEVVCLYCVENGGLNKC